MFIEDYILGIAGYGKWIFASTITGTVAPQDAVFFESVALQISNGNALTEKQGILALKLIKNNIDILIPTVFPDVVKDLENPQWKMKFRVLPTVKKVSITNKAIGVEFPFDQYIVDLFRKRNSTVHDLHKGTWDADRKQWIFGLTETNIAYVGDLLLNKGFNIDDEFLTQYAAVLDVRENIEKHLPILVKKDSTYSLDNVHSKVPQIDTTQLLDALFAARDYGITVWDDVVEKDIDNTINPITKKILSNKELWIDSKTTSIGVFKELIDHGGPALIIIPGGNEAALVRDWTEFAIGLGIDRNDISVMFRLPNDRADFNQYVRDMNLNNPVGSNTKIVFVSTKITKPLIKSGIAFNTVINLGYYNYMHFSMSTIVDNARNLVYYSMKEPTKNNKWQPHTL